MRRSLRHLATEGDKLGGYGLPRGHMALRMLIAESLAEQQIAAGPEHVLLTQGSSQALDLAARQLLKPGGFIALGLYSARAREHLRPAKALARSYRPDTVRELRQAIINAPDLDPVRGPAVASRDFYATSGCRDLLMHVQEHELPLPSLVLDPKREA